MKKYIFGLLAMILCVSFCFAGCSLFPEDTTAKENQIVAQAGDITITRDEFVRGYNNYYSTFYSNNNGDADASLDALVKYLVTKKAYVSKAEDLLNKGNIELSKTEKNYLWYTTYASIIKNIETFEKDVKKDLGLIDEDDDQDDQEDKTQESNFIYTPFEKEAEIIYNQTTGEYEISLIETILIFSNGEDGETYEYLPKAEHLDYNDSNLTLYTNEYIVDKIEEEKLFANELSLTAEQQQLKTVTRDAIRRYIQQLKKNEENKNLSTIDQEVFDREIERIYNIIYENFLVNKLYTYETNSIQISEDEVLNLYLSKVQECYDRYLNSPETFINELTKTVGNAKIYAGYSTEPNCVEDVFYIPVDDITEDFFYVTHIVISLTSEQVQAINELKQRCEGDESLSEEYYQTEFYKIVPNITSTIINQIIELKIQLENEDITASEYEIELLNIIGSKLLKVDERDSEGYVTKEVMTAQEMIASLYKDLDEIYIKYYAQNGTAITLNGHTYNPTENGLITNETAGDNNSLVLDQLETNYLNERAEKFNEYIYKYSDDQGTIQIQKTYFGSTNTNWYLYAMGTEETDNGFVTNFVSTARSLYTNGIITGVDTLLMQNWEKDRTTGVETLKEQSTAYSTMMYCGKIQNLFACFDDQKFTLQDLFDEEVENNYFKYHSLLTMDYYRLGLTNNKTMFDLIFEEYYKGLYNKVTTEFDDELMKDKEIVLHEELIKDIIG